MDFTQVETVMGLATAAIGMTGKAANTADAIKKLFASDKAPDASEALKLVNALAVELTSANMMNVDLSTALKQLNQALKLEDQFEREKARYELFNTSASDMVYRLRQEAANGEPMHYICPACLKRDRLIIFITGAGDYKHCQVNNQHVYKFSDTPIRQNSPGNYF
ncbi:MULTISPECIES: hypothetical protein [unclassified Rhizobium]|jgi:hypothetical protein|uniref:hypothetical protein n=1 Tax=unclassified Rhizobium TaxID=2613769 RepID=UPI0013AF72F6|nr:hypothetical protein [Rhizobium sp. UBA1881]